MQGSRCPLGIGLLYLLWANKVTIKKMPTLRLRAKLTYIYNEKIFIFFKSNGIYIDIYYNTLLSTPNNIVLPSAHIHQFTGMCEYGICEHSMC